MMTRSDQPVHASDTCTVVSCSFYLRSDKSSRQENGGFMRLRIGALALTLLLAVGVGCSKPSQTQSDNSAQPQDNSAAGNSMSAPGAANSPSAPAMPTAVTVPAGKVLTVRLADEVGSKVSQPGQSFGGSLAKSVDVDGAVAIPAGAKVEGLVVDAKPLGRFAGGALLELKLPSIHVNGEQLPIHTAMFTETLKGKG